MTRIAPRLLIVAALAAGALASPAFAAGDDTLYCALGERDGIAHLMTDFVARLKTDERIGGFFKDTKAKYLADQLSDQVCELAGGPCRLDEPDMKKAHEDMAIHAADFNRLVELLQQTMDARGVPFGVQNRLLAKLAPMHREIVNAH